MSSTPKNKVVPQTSPDGGIEKSIAEGAEELRQLLREQQRRMLINPTSRFMQRWDPLMMIMLIFVAIVTPYEVAFLETKLGPLFWVNRGVDIVFIMDMAVQFCLMYESTQLIGGPIFVKDPGKIAKRYLKSWFLVDLISILPFEIAAVTQEGSSRTLKRMKIIRVVRLLKLLRLVRIMRQSRMFRHIEVNISISYSIINICKYVIVMLCVSHWFACIWGIMPVLEDRKAETWITAWAEGLSFDKDECTSPRNTCPEGGDCQFPGDLAASIRNAAFWTGCYEPSDLFAASLHWSVMTLTSIGYGDIAPKNTTEFYVCVVLMILGGVTWAYIIGSICAAAANLDPNTTLYQNQMDELNYFVHSRQIKLPLALRLRSFFMHSKQMLKEKALGDVLTRLSPDLAAECVQETCTFVRNGQIGFLKKCTNEFLVSIVCALRIQQFAPKEVVSHPQTMFILRSGLAAKAGRIMPINGVAGQDLIINAPHLREDFKIMCLTYVELFILSRHDLDQCLEDHPVDKEHVSRWHARFALLRGIMFFARFEVDEAGNPRMRSHSASMTWLDHMTLSDTAVQPGSPHARRSDSFLSRSVTKSVRDVLVSGTATAPPALQVPSGHDEAAAVQAGHANERLSQSMRVARFVLTKAQERGQLSSEAKTRASIQAGNVGVQKKMKDMEKRILDHLDARFKQLADALKNQQMELRVT